jgi:hypothetical protein
VPTTHRSLFIQQQLVTRRKRLPPEKRMTTVKT